MRPVWLAIAFLACGGGSRPEVIEAPPRAPSVLASEDGYRPPYGKPELQQALISERAAEAVAERKVAELEAGEASEVRQRVARADLAVRRRFLASLETCEATGRACPPRLDEPAWSFDPDAARPAPPLDAPLRFDLASWQAVTAELHGRACACRTLSCVDGVGVAIDQLEPRPTLDVQGDEVASQSITWARECLFRLRGRNR